MGSSVPFRHLFALHVVFFPSFLWWNFPTTERYFNVTKRTGRRKNKQPTQNLKSFTCKAKFLSSHQKKTLFENVQTTFNQSQSCCCLCSPGEQKHWAASSFYVWTRSKSSAYAILFCEGNVAILCHAARSSSLYVGNFTSFPSLIKSWTRRMRGSPLSMALQNWQQQFWNVVAGSKWIICCFAQKTMLSGHSIALTTTGWWTVRIEQKLIYHYQSALYQMKKLQQRRHWKWKP